MRPQVNISQLVEGSCKWKTLVDTENFLCPQGNLCIDTTFSELLKLCGVHKGY